MRSRKPKFKKGRNQVITRRVLGMVKRRTNTLPLLPHTYGRGILTVLPRDPEFIFAYWELPPVPESEIQVWRSSNPLLRVFELNRSGEPNNFFDLFIDLESRNWYIKVPQPNALYRVELGYLDEYQQFRVILKSNLVKVPSNSSSNIIDPDWPPIVPINLHLNHWDINSAFMTG